MDIDRLNAMLNQLQYLSALHISVLSYVSVKCTAVVCIMWLCCLLSMLTCHVLDWVASWHVRCYRCI